MHWNTGQLLRPLKVQSRAPVKVTQSCLTSQPHGLHSPWNSPGQNIGVHSLLLLQGILPTQGLNPGLPHCRQILYQLSHKGSPRILEWVAYPSSSGSSWPRNHTGVSCMQLWMSSRSSRLAVSKLETQKSQWHKFKSKFEGRRLTTQLQDSQAEREFFLTQLFSI